MSTQLSKLPIVVTVILTAIVLGVIYPQPAEAQAQVIKETRSEPFEHTFFAADYSPPCLTEDVLVVGTQRLNLYTIIDPKGRVHFNGHIAYHVTAIGLSSGDRYSVQGPTGLVEYDFEDGSPHEISWADKIQIVGPGRVSNLVYRFWYHLVVTANGVQTLEREREETSCH